MAARLGRVSREIRHCDAGRKLSVVGFPIRYPYADRIKNGHSPTIYHAFIKTVSITRKIKTYLGAVTFKTSLTDASSI